jgi:hypothetical protein
MDLEHKKIDIYQKNIHSIIYKVSLMCVFMSTVNWVRLNLSEDILGVNIVGLMPHVFF